MVQAMFLEKKIKKSLSWIKLQILSSYPLSTFSKMSLSKLVPLYLREKTRNNKKTRMTKKLTKKRKK